MLAPIGGRSSHLRDNRDICRLLLHLALAMADVQAPHGSVIEPLDARASDKDALVGRLDELLERYLNTLDEYQKLGQQLSKHLSDVCLR